MQVIDLSQGEGIKSGLKTLADALTPDPDKAMRSAYLQQQAQKTGAETARLERQNELATQNASIWANNGGAAGLAKNPALLHIYQANELEGLNHENADNALKFFSGSYAQDPTTMSQTPMGGGPSVPQALMAPGGIAPPRGGSSAGAGPIASAAEQFRDKVTAAARMHGVDPDLAMRVLSAESGGNPAAVSQKGAKGLFQLTDGTAGDLHVADPFNPDQNIDGGVRYIKQMHDMFGGDTRQAMAAYNWGPGNVQKLGMAHMPAETRGYLAKLGLNDGTLVASAGELPPGSLAGASPAPQAPTQSPVAPTQGVNSPGVSQVPAGITDPYMERLAYMGTGVPHARDTFTGMQMDQANEIQKQFIQHPASGAGAGGMFSGNSMDAQDSNVVMSYNQKKQSGQPTTQAEDMAYGISYNRLYGPKTETRTGPHGELLSIPVQPSTPSGLFAPGGGAAPQASGPASTGGQPGSPAAGPGGATTIVPGKTPMEGLSGEENRRLSLESRQASGILDAFNLYGYDPETHSMDPTGYAPGLNVPISTSVGSNAVPGGITDMASQVLLSENDKRAQQLFQSVINPILRLDSGAATPEMEIGRYSRMLPNASDSGPDRLRKMEYLNTLFNQTAAFAEAKGIPFQDLLRSMAGSDAEAMKSQNAAFNAYRGGPRQAEPSGTSTQQPGRTTPNGIRWTVE
jgi:soluble lytic murein transglycosylase-like protein